MNLKEATFRASNINKELKNLCMRLENFKHFPISVNNIKQDNTTEEENMMTLAKQILTLADEKIELSNKIHRANIESGISDLLTEVKLKRDLLSYAEDLLTSSPYSDKKSGPVVEHIGVVKYDILNRELIEDFVTKLSKEVEEISIKIDQLNMETEV